ncbi:phosphatase PAP2 family protein [Pseudochrobactrum asaccharolyticum]|uniref:phosphatase PAP2 family protein n=1 Tax=Pseudochrobactrum asaccharolyticum TaxID=354351 RepID=UPI0040419278
MDLNHIVPAFIRKSAVHTCYAPLIAVARLTIFVSFIFMIAPAVDITVSGWFADPQGKFPLHGNKYLLTLRDFHRLLPAIIVPMLLIGVVIQALSKQSWLPAPHKLLYIISVYAIGAAAIVHSLKYLVGRARPNEIMEFGGAMTFSPAWQIVSSCQNNCSFPSGEAASAMAMLAIPLVLGGVYRWYLLALTAAAAFIFSLNRVVMGAHFLSDVTLSWLFVALVMAWLWPVFDHNGTRIDLVVNRIGKYVRKQFRSSQL